MSRKTEKMTYTDGSYFCNICDSPHEGEELADACFDACSDIVKADGKTFVDERVGYDSDGHSDGETKYALPEWCSTNGCESRRCHRCFPRKECKVHEKCVEFQEEDADDGDNGEKFSENYNGGYGTYS
jgi:hypothetical protein